MVQTISLYQNVSYIQHKKEKIAVSQEQIFYSDGQITFLKEIRYFFLHYQMTFERSSGNLNCFSQFFYAEMIRKLFNAPKMFHIVTNCIWKPFLSGEWVLSKCVNVINLFNILYSLWVFRYMRFIVEVALNCFFLDTVQRVLQWCTLGDNF